MKSDTEYTGGGDASERKLLDWIWRICIMGYYFTKNDGFFPYFHDEVTWRMEAWQNIKNWFCTECDVSELYHMMWWYTLYPNIKELWNDDNDEKAECRRRYVCTFCDITLETLQEKKSETSALLAVLIAEVYTTLFFSRFLIIHRQRQDGSKKIECIKIYRCEVCKKCSSRPATCRIQAAQLKRKVVKGKREEGREKGRVTKGGKQETANGRQDAKPVLMRRQQQSITILAWHGFIILWRLPVPKSIFRILTNFLFCVLTT